MKRFYDFLLVFAFMAGTAVAQQLPNSGFEGAFEPKAPWTSTGNTHTGNKTVTLYSPDGWTASNVIGLMLFGNPAGTTAVVDAVEGHESDKAMKVFNAPNSTLKTQIVPGYLTLGSTWSTSVLGKENDGGTWGGMEFTYRPDALSFFYKRERVSAPESASNSERPLINLRSHQPLLFIYGKAPGCRKTFRLIS